MSKLKQTFENKKAFVAYIAGGDPDLETTKELILEIQKAGADIIEVGIPFSDPIAQNVSIQEADYRSLKNGCTTDKLCEALKEIKDEVTVPLVFMTDINVIYRYGTKKFMDRCNECGVSGIVVPDCPYEERDELHPYAKEAGIDCISLITGALPERIRMIAKEAQGFLYGIFSWGSVNAKDNGAEDIGAMMDVVREVTDVPCAVECGSLTPEQVAELCKYADGAIADSAIVEIIAKYGKDSVSYVGEYVRSMKEALSNV